MAPIFLTLPYEESATFPEKGKVITTLYELDATHTTLRKRLFLLEAKAYVHEGITDDTVFVDDLSMISGPRPAALRQAIRRFDALTTLMPATIEAWSKDNDSPFLG